MLLSRGLVDEAKLEPARRRSELQRIPLHRAVVDLGLVPEREAYGVAAGLAGLEFVDLECLAVTKEVLDVVPVRTAVNYRAVPLRAEGGLLTLAFAEPPPPADLSRLRLLLGMRLRAVIAGPTAVRDFIKRHYGLGAETIQKLRGDEAEAPAEQVFDVRTAEDEGAVDASIALFVEQIVSEALRLEATDIHIEPFGTMIRLRYRIDGMLQEIPVPPTLKSHYSAVVSRLKVMADLDITERRLAHDGRISMKRAGDSYDLRVSIIPTTYGETVCLRVLGRSSLFLDLGQLGMDSSQRALMEQLTALPQGLALITGPTGSGKTTTLYAALAHANDGHRKIITIEDPVEYKLAGVSQIQTRDDVGLTFSSGLRSVLRHDPDVILIGEIRDRETADIALRAAQTGHLVLSTLHTNDSLSAVTRLLEMGVEPFVIGASLVCSIAQRLARRICPHCSRLDEGLASEIREEIARSLSIPAGQVSARRGGGCPECRGVGLRGRVAVYEFLTIDDDLVDAIRPGLRTGEIREIARRRGFRTLRDNGWRKVQEGLIPVTENERLTRRLSLPES